MSTKSILRWAGGKSRLPPHLGKLLPRKWNRYIEPMVGGGALFFSVGPDESILADVNGDLINFYRVLKTNPSRLISALMKMKASRSRYYELREIRPNGSFAQATRFAYLNRLCWNGLFRVNQKGDFNVPIGDRLPKSLWNRDSLMAAATAIQNAKLLHADVFKTLRNAKSGDFVYLDPPYPRGSRNVVGFNRYSSDTFSLDDHRRLAEQVRILSERGVQVMLTIAGVNRLLSLYPAKLERQTIIRNSLISCKGDTRRRVKEVILHNY